MKKMQMSASLALPEELEIGGMATVHDGAEPETCSRGMTGTVAPMNQTRPWTGTMGSASYWQEVEQHSER